MAETWVSWPECEIHGRMRHRENFWECNGYDGEGCESMITDDELSGCVIRTCDPPRGAVRVTTVKLDGEGSLDLYPPQVLMTAWPDR